MTINFVQHSCVQGGLAITRTEVRCLYFRCVSTDVIFGEIDVHYCFINIQSLLQLFITPELMSYDVYVSGENISNRLIELSVQFSEASTFDTFCSYFSCFTLSIFLIFLVDSGPFRPNHNSVFIYRTM